MTDNTQFNPKSQMTRSQCWVCEKWFDSIQMKQYADGRICSCCLEKVKLEDALYHQIVKK